MAVSAIYDKEGELSEGGITLLIRNLGSNGEKISIFDAYSGASHTRQLHPNESATFVSDLRESFGWYDLTVTVASDAGFRRQLAGHVETGSPSKSDPAIGGGVGEAAEVGAHEN